MFKLNNKDTTTALLMMSLKSDIKTKNVYGNNSGLKLLPKI